ncbi:hypothetical protein B0T17DRAFT_479739, partial [Bombardia bombarda]
PVPPANPTPSRDDPVQVKVLAAGLHNLVRGRASGKHYSAKTLPHIPGADGVGTLVPSGQLVYFSAMAVPGAGSFVGYINLPLKATAPIPDGADPVRAAGLLNPVMASWMAIKKRTDVAKLPAGWTCVIVGATSLSGMVAVSVAREFGAGKVVGIARDGKKMEGVTGLDEQIVLGSGEGGLAGTEWNGALDADVILDFIYGEPTLELFKALKAGKPVQYVQIGTMAGRTVDLPGDVLRSKDITIRGTGPGAWEMREVAVEAPKMLKAIAEGRVDAVGYGFKEVKLADIESEWENVEGRMVVV